MRIDSAAAFQASRERDQKARPEVRELKQPETETARTSQRAVRFQKHHKAERWMVEVVDIYNNEVIREIPNRKALDVVGELKNLVGKMQDTRC